MKFSVILFIFKEKLDFVNGNKQKRSIQDLLKGKVVQPNLQVGIQ